ncbi:MAG: VCBS repeat-containing protein, partial [Gammaproteobacteria bacterium]|nr:VCBS repeat-containing protein [Gammaproteobacteria bacterium]
MRKGFPVLLVLLATVTHQAVAITGSDQTLVNDCNAPVRLHGERINYQLQDIQLQKSNQPSNTTSKKISTLVQDAETSQNIKPGSALDSTFLNSSTQSDTTLTSVLEVFGLGAGIGINGMLSGDYNNDGVTELVLGNPTSIVFAQTIDGKFGLQSQLQFSAGIGKLAYFRDLSTDGHFAFFSHDGK